MAYPIWHAIYFEILCFKICFGVSTALSAKECWSNYALYFAPPWYDGRQTAVFSLCYINLLWIIRLMKQADEIRLEYVKARALVTWQLNTCTWLWPPMHSRVVWSVGQAEVFWRITPLVCIGWATGWVVTPVLSNWPGRIRPRLAAWTGLNELNEMSFFFIRFLSLSVMIGLKKDELSGVAPWLNKPGYSVWLQNILAFQLVGQCFPRLLGGAFRSPKIEWFPDFSQKVNEKCLN